MWRSQPRRYQGLVRRLKLLGFEQVSQSQLPDGCERLVLLIRSSQPERIAEKPVAVRPILQRMAE